MGENLYNSSFQIPPYILNDLCTRFIINLPEEISNDNIRIFFQIELAYWFYLDFYCPENADLRQLNIKEFSTQIFRHCPNLSQQLDNFDTILCSWREYKQAVPTYGAIMLDPSLQYCLLVQGFWDKTSWGFPKGKINENEAPVDCAIREVLEETGYDIADKINPKLYLEHKLNEQIRGLYIIPGVPMDTKFQAKTRQEIKSFGWFRVDSLPSHKKDLTCKLQHNLSPNAFFMVVPFVKGLRQFINAKLCGIDPSYGIPIHSGANSQFLPHTASAGGIIFSDTRHSSERRRQKQSPFSQSHESGEIYGSPRDQGSLMASGGYNPKLRTKSESPPYRLNASAGTKVASPRQGKKQAVANKSASPVKPTSKTSKPIRILKRERAEKSDKTNVSEVPEWERRTPGRRSESQGLGGGEDLPADYVCPAWSNFKLDIDQVLAAMFPAVH